MSLWRFNNAEFEIDFTDAAFMEKVENAYQNMIEDLKHVQKVGKQSEIIRSKCNVFFKFFESVFGPGSREKLFGDKVSINLCVQASESLYNFGAQEEDRYRQIANKYNPKKRNYPKKKYYG